jgi:hypothetical protein
MPRKRPNPPALASGIVVGARLRGVQAGCFSDRGTDRLDAAELVGRFTVQSRTIGFTFRPPNSLKLFR